MAPRTTKALILREASEHRLPLFHHARLEERPIPTLKPGEVLVKMRAVSFNRRDVGCSHDLYLAAFEELTRSPYNSCGFGWGNILVLLSGACLGPMELVCSKSILCFQFTEPFYIGTIIASADPNDALLQQRVFLMPMRGWESHAEAPENLAE
jgi:hypothetical protein